MEIASAFVRIRPDLHSFGAEVERGVKNSLRRAGTVATPGLGRANQQLRLFATEQNRAGEAAVVNSRRIRSAAEQEARSTIAARLAERRSLEQQLVAQRAVAAQARRGSRTQVEANLLAAESASALGVSATRSERHAQTHHGTLNKLERGAVAGSGAFRGLGRNIAYSSLSFVGAYGFINVVKGAIGAVGDLNNQTARARTTFGSSATAVETWANRVGRHLGYAKSSTLGAANAFGVLFRGLAIGPRTSARFAEDLTRSAAALSLAAGESDPSKAEAALRTALAGRGLGARRYGIFIDQNAIKAEALKLGLTGGRNVDTTKVELARRRLAEDTVALSLARAKAPGSLAAARAQDRVIADQEKLKKALAGSTVQLTSQQKAIAAHALIMEQSRGALSRYGASLRTDAGESRRFHEGVAELKEELGKELYPSFEKARRGITNYINDIREGGPKHKQFIHDLHDVEKGARFVYQSLRLIARAAQVASNAVGGYGNAIKIAFTLYAANSAAKLATNIGRSRLATILLGRSLETVGGKAGGAGGRVRGLGLALRNLPRSTKIGITVVVGYEIIQHEAKALRKLLGLSADDGVHGGDTSSFLGIEGLGSGSTARDIRRRGNPFPLGTARHAAFEAGRRGTARDATIQTGHGGSFTVPNDGVIAQAYERGLAARKTALAKHVKDTKDDPTIKKNAYDSGAEIAHQTLKGLKSKEHEIAAQLRKVGQDLAYARRQAAQAIAQANKDAVDAERQSILQAKSNLNSLGSTLSDQIGQLVDAQAQRESAAPSGPLSRRLKRLEALIHQGRATPELVREAAKLEHEINAQAEQKQANTDKRKQRITRRLADLTDEFNTGKISFAQFNRGVQQLLKREHITYRAAGRFLGTAFADGFRVALGELRAQARAIAQTPARLRRQGTGFESQVVRPAEVLKEQAQRIAQVTSEQRHRLRELADRQAKLLGEQRRANREAHQQRAALITLARAQHHDRAQRAPRHPHHDHRRATATHTLADILLGRLIHQYGTAKTKQGQSDETAKEQRRSIISHGRQSNHHLAHIQTQAERQTELLRDMKRELKPRRQPRRRGGGSSPLDAAREAATYLVP